MATFAEVKIILDGLVTGVDPDTLKRKHGSDAFSWETACHLRKAVVDTGVRVYPVIDSRYVGNKQADETYLIRLLSGPIDEEGLPQMPKNRPAASSAD